MSVDSPNDRTRRTNLMRFEALDLFFLLYRHHFYDRMVRVENTFGEMPVFFKTTDMSLNQQ